MIVIKKTQCSYLPQVSKKNGANPKNDKNGSSFFQYFFPVARTVLISFKFVEFHVIIYLILNDLFPITSLNIP